MFMSCETYYEQYLGDYCDKECEQCFGNKWIYICIEDFFVSGETVLDEVKVKRGDWFWETFSNDNHVGLECGDGKVLRITHEMLNKYFIS